jgi:DNA-binding NtrC family response regulator/tetratricopeptide (TPR) repeat protein
MDIRAAATAFRNGRFTEADARLKEDTDAISATLRLEIDYFLGRADRIRTQGASIFQRAGDSAILASRCASVIAAQHCDDGAFEAALCWSQRSVELAELSADLRQLSSAICALLERTYNRAAYSASLPLALYARRISVRSGDPDITAATHLTFGRLEARIGNYASARRHFALTRELLPKNSNLWIEASVDLDESSLLSLIGDMRAALELGARAVNVAEDSGWAKGIVAAAANCAFFCVSLGRFDDAQRHLQRAHREAFSTPSYCLALDETRARLAYATRNYELAERLLIAHEEKAETVQPWYELSAQETLIRVLLAQKRWPEALDRADRALALAEKTGAVPFLTSLRFVRAEALLSLGRKPEELGLLAGQARSDSITLTGSFLATLGKALIAGGSTAAGGRYLRRSDRLLDSNQMLNTETTAGSTNSDPASDTNLDTAVAVIELGGHPHILAREALAAIDAAGCANASAAIVTGTDGERVIETHGWTEREALAAARKPEQFEVVALGSHRDEPWQLVVDPKPELEHRCTLIALRKLIATALTLERYRRDEQQRTALWPAEALDGEPESVWASEQTSEVLGVARRIAPTALSVLITGETGTGKEMLARAIHRASDRADKPMLPFNCTAVPRDMIESQLFGYRKGAFTGADGSFPGVIRSAAGGTLFLDEIADVPLDVQPKLLRFLETHEIHPLGEPQPIKVDVRVVAATNAKLEQLVADGRFREDLFYRLNVVRLKLPPLRERREEIPPLVDYYLRKYGEELKKGRLTLSDETLEYLLLYSWPGNLRQLANEVRRMVAMAERDSTLTPGQLSSDIQASRRTIPATPATEPELRVRIDQPLPAAVQLLEQTMVKSALDKTHGRVEEAAKMLGISRKGLFLKRRRWGLNHPHAQSN